MLSLAIAANPPAPKRIFGKAGRASHATWHALVSEDALCVDTWNAQTELAARLSHTCVSWQSRAEWPMAWANRGAVASDSRLCAEVCTRRSVSTQPADEPAPVWADTSHGSLESQVARRKEIVTNNHTPGPEERSDGFKRTPIHGHELT